MEFKKHNKESHKQRVQDVFAICTLCQENFFHNKQLEEHLETKIHKQNNIGTDCIKYCENKTFDNKEEQVPPICVPPISLIPPTENSVVPETLGILPPIFSPNVSLLNIHWT